MSGGSYDYLCYDQADDFVIVPSKLADMADALDKYAPGSAPARDTRMLLAELREFQDRVAERVDALRPTWKAVEWYDSCDWGPERIEEEVGTYTGLNDTGLMSWAPNDKEHDDR